MDRLSMLPTHHLAPLAVWDTDCGPWVVLAGTCWRVVSQTDAATAMGEALTLAACTGPRAPSIPQLQVRPPQLWAVRFSVACASTPTRWAGKGFPPSQGRDGYKHAPAPPTGVCCGRSPVPERAEFTPDTALASRCSLPVLDTNGKVPCLCTGTGIWLVL